MSSPQRIRNVGLTVGHGCATKEAQERAGDAHARNHYCWPVAACSTQKGASGNADAQTFSRREETGGTCSKATGLDLQALPGSPAGACKGGWP